MKLLRYGLAGQEKPGILDASGNIRDLSQHINDIDGATVGPESLAKLAALDLASLPLVDSASRIGPCVARPGKLIGIGLNYSDHAAESGLPIPKEPIVFQKATTSISGPYDPVLLPPGSTKLDWEVELAFVIGTKARHVSEADAERVAGSWPGPRVRTALPTRVASCLVRSRGPPARAATIAFATCLANRSWP